jgi:hypothetical protein
MHINANVKKDTTERTVNTLIAHINLLIIRYVKTAVYEQSQANGVLVCLGSTARNVSISHMRWNIRQQLPKLELTPNRLQVI